MAEQDCTPEERFAAVAAALHSGPGVTYSPPEAPGANKFGSSALKVNSRIFAMLVRGELVVKLPRQRVDAFILAGEGQRFDSNRGRPMKEWLVLARASALDWRELAGEARDFVAR